MLQCISNNQTIDKQQLIYYLARSAYLCNDGNFKNFKFKLEPTEWLSSEDLQNRISLWLPSGNFLKYLKIVGFDFDIKEDSVYLQGVAIHETYGRIPGFHFVDRDVLELNPNDRLRQLFTIESEWTQEEIVPFIQYES